MGFDQHNAGPQPQRLKE